MNSTCFFHLKFEQFNAGFVAESGWEFLLWAWLAEWLHSTESTNLYADTGNEQNEDVVFSSRSFSLSGRGNDK